MNLLKKTTFTISCVLHTYIYNFLFWYFRASSRLAQKRKLQGADDNQNQTRPKISRIVPKDPHVQVGRIKATGKNAHLVPRTKTLTTIQKHKNSSSSIVQSATKKPNGKGYSKGNYGEKTVIFSSPQKSQSHFDEVPDLVSPDGKIMSDHLSSPKRRRKKGHSKLSGKSVAAKKSEKHR